MMIIITKQKTTKDRNKNDVIGLILMTSTNIRAVLSFFLSFDFGGSLQTNHQRMLHCFPPFTYHPFETTTTQNHAHDSNDVIVIAYQCNTLRPL